MIQPALQAGGGSGPSTLRAGAFFGLFHFAFGGRFALQLLHEVRSALFGSSHLSQIHFEPSWRYSEISSPGISGSGSGGGFGFEACCLTRSAMAARRAAASRSSGVTIFGPSSSKLGSGSSAPPLRTTKPLEAWLL